MTVRDFESAILAKGLQPIHLFMGRGKHVKWFLCVETDNVKCFAGILYDRTGKAWAIPYYGKCIEDEDNTVIQLMDDTLLVNGISTVRAEDLDINRR